MKSGVQTYSSIWLVILVVIAMAIGFFSPLSLSHWTGFVIKGVLFLFICFLLYMILPELQSDINKIKNKYVKEEDTLDEETQDNLQNLKRISPGEAFQWYIEECLSIVRTSFVATCSGIYLRHGSDGLIFHGGATAEGFVKRKIRVSEGDLVDQVARQKNLVFENNLPIGMHLCGFEDIETRAFMGVPMIWKDELVGVLALGSEATETFNVDDQEILQRYGNMFTQVMMIYYQSLNSETTQQLLQIHLQIEKLLKNSVDEESAVYGFVQHLKTLFQFDRLTISIKRGEEGIVRHVYGQVDDIDQGFKYPMDKGLNGWILKRNTPLLIHDMQEGDYQRPRYVEGENTKHGLRSFLGVPLGNKTMAWGVVSLESRRIDQYGEKSQNVLSALIMPLEFALERFLNMQMQQNMSANKNYNQTENIL